MARWGVPLVPDLISVARIQIIWVAEIQSRRHLRTRRTRMRPRPGRMGFRAGPRWCSRETARPPGRWTGRELVGLRDLVAYL